MDPEKIVKCACGLVMRQKKWADHWRGCYQAGGVEVDEHDVQNLLRWEELKRQESEDEKKGKA
ncbi:MAG: hypothetical protein ABFE07_29040 [Armatimonadia bacterium]